MGPAGPKGDLGFPGLPGLSGRLGSKGARGDTGPKGLPSFELSKGYPGDPGFFGERGPAGLPGDDGFPGFPGLKGGRGDPGVSGRVGAPGFPGPKGERGIDGSVGDDGRPGFSDGKGELGDEGDNGLPGLSGRPGLKGERGNPGNSDYSSKYSSDYSSSKYGSSYSSKYNSDYKSSSSYSSSRQAQSSSYSSSSATKKGTDYSTSNAYSSRLSPTPRYSPPKTTSPAPAKRVQKPYGKKTTEDGTSPVRSRTSTKELEIPDDSTMIAPAFTEGLKDLKIKDGEALSLKCVATGDPDPQIEWFKNGELLHSSDIVDLKYKNGVATLSIGEVFPEDEGTYVCKATNSLGSVSTTGKLTVLPMEKKKSAKGGSGKPPRITKHLKSLVIKDGDPVTLSTTIKCASSFDVVWLHNDKEIKNSKDFQYKTEGEECQLIIPEIFPEDAGIYTCEVFNDGGEAFSSCTLIVLVPNEPPKGPGFTKFPESQTIHENQSATFTAELEKDADKVTWSKDGKALEGTHCKLTKSGKKCTLSIEKCTATDVGQYVVRAVSSALGDSIATFSLNVLTESDL